MHPHMQSQPAQSACPCPLDLYGYSALIHLGFVASPERFDLAVHAVKKTLRFRPEGIKLIVAIEDREMLPWLEELPHCVFQAPKKLQALLHDYRKSGSLLVPDQNESAGDATLHALASGVPLDALNFHALYSSAREARPRHGEAFLAVGHARNRSN